MNIGPSSGFMGGMFNNPNMQAGLANMGNNMDGMMGGQPNQQGGFGALAGALGKGMSKKFGPKGKPGTNPTAGMPNNPFNKVQFGGPTPGGPINTGPSNMSPMQGGTPMPMNPQPITPNAPSPMSPPSSMGGQQGGGMGGGLWNPFMNPNMQIQGPNGPIRQNQQPPGLNFPVMY
jgi:hypothetical protein